jgi:ABC-type Fe3+ transport system permease subunit
MYEAADVDGASPFQKFRYLSLPMLMGILSVLFLLRFIWTFNKFDDIFLLTGGNAGTRTLTVNVYEQAFALSNIGAGAAVAVVILLCLLGVQLVLLPLHVEGGGAVSGSAKQMKGPVDLSSEQRAEPEGPFAGAEPRFAAFGVDPRGACSPPIPPRVFSER